MTLVNPFSRFDSKYEQIGCIGHGGFSSVFLAKTRNSERKVALKVFHVETDNVTSSAEQIDEPPEAFIREISIMKKLQEQDNEDSSDTRDLSIVYFEEWCNIEHFAYIVMNYCSGGTLANQIESRAKGELYNGSPYAERRIAWYALQLVEALTFMHDRGVFHYDVKSSNVLIDWESGGKVVLADLGSAVHKDEEEIFGFTKSYAPPELLVAHEEDNYDGVDGEKVDAFGLGCILFELICCNTLTDIIDDEDTTLADIITEKGLDAVVDEKCGKLSWLPRPDEQLQNNNQSAVLIGYSFALKSFLKSVLEPDPIRRWKPSELENPLREDPHSPLLANILTASHTPVPGDIVTMDNIQLGMFVQYGPDFGCDDADTDVFEVTSKPDGTSSVSFQSITAMDEYCDVSFEEMRLDYLLQQASALSTNDNRGIIGVISKIDPDALYAEAIWPINDGASSPFQGCCYRIGAGNLFELQVGPILCNDFFDEINHPPRKTGLISTNMLVSQLRNKLQCTQPVGPGLVVNGNSRVVYTDPKADYSLIAPLNKVNIPFISHNLPVCPIQEFVGPNSNCSPCPEYWDLDRGQIVEEDCLHKKDAITEMFFSEHGGMNIQEYEITSVKRVQIEQLWSSYAHTMEDIAIEAWGLCNERYMFLGTGRHSPETLLQTDPENFFHEIVSKRSRTKHLHGKIYFSTSSAYQDYYSFRDWGANGEKKLILSRVALGRVLQSRPSTSPLFQDVTHHSLNQQLPHGCLRISICNPFQAYPEYIISYKLLPQHSQQFPMTPSMTTRNVLYRSIELPPSSPFQNIQLFYPRAPASMTTPWSSNHGSSYPSFGSTSPLLTSSSSAPTTTPPPLGSYNDTVSVLQRGGTTSIPYTMTRKLDGTDHINIHSITAMPAYELKSFEELRLEDYTCTTTTPSSNTTIPQEQANDDNQKIPSPSTTNSHSNSPNTNSHSNSPSNHRSNTKKCVVCLEKDVRRILLPCGHPCLCEVCGTSQGLKKLKYKCPECRGGIQDTVIIYGRVVDD